MAFLFICVSFSLNGLRNVNDKSTSRLRPRDGHVVLIADMNGVDYDTAELSQAKGILKI